MINLFKVFMSSKASDRVAAVLRSGMIGEGPVCEEFKNKLEQRFKCKNLVLLNSGTSALTLALRLADVAGGEVITSPFTMIATNVAIKATGAAPVFADIEEFSVSISPEDIARKITPKTKAIMVTHVAGIPCDMAAIKKIAKGIPIISDAAHAIDTEYKNKHISHWADYTCLSFQSIKQLTTGDGGALITKSKKDYKRAEKLKWFGMSRKTPKGKTRLQHQMTADVAEWGYKFHMNDIAASIGLANFPSLGWITSKQRRNAGYYKKKLFNIPTMPKNCQPSYWGYYLFLEDRDKFIKYMTKQGIEVSPMWRRNDKYSAFKSTHYLQNMSFLGNKIVFIPVGWWLTSKERRHVCESIIRYYSSQKTPVI